MGLRGIVAAPVAVLAILALGVITWLAGRADLPPMVLKTAYALVGGAGVALVILALGQATAMRRALHNLPDLVRATAWGERGGDFPDIGGGQEIAALRTGLGDLANDMAREIETRAKMERMALTDPLTGLPNRRGLFEFFTKIANTQPTGPAHPIGVMHIDLDHFKTINDTHGHDAGDFVLREATRRMATTIRDTDLLARLGGDEFVIVAPQVENEWMLERIAERIIGLFQEPVLYGEVPCRVGTSIGIVLGGQRGKMLDPARLLINADIALCAAKERGRDQHALFTSSMARAVQTRQGHADEIRDGVEAKLFHPAFQPVLNRDTGQVIAIEVTPRWHHPEHGILGPESFLDTAEAHNVIEDLAQQVLERAVTHVSSWRRQSLHPPVMHLCATRTQMMSPALVDKLSWTIDEANLPPHRISIQVEEIQCTGRGIELAFANIAKLRDLGLGVVLSGFGAGPGALTTVAALQAGVLKLAPQVVSGLADPRSADAARSLIQAATGTSTALDLSLVATAIDSDAALAALTDLGLPCAQGTAIAAPMGPTAMADWLAEHNLRPAA